MQALAEGQHSDANLICVLMCSVSHCPCLFHTSCHHVPSHSLSALEPVLSADSPEKNSGPNICPWFMDFEHFCVAQSYILPGTNNLFVLNDLLLFYCFDDDKHNLVASAKKMTYSET